MMFKSSLRVVRMFDPWGSKLCTCPLKYNLNPYTGCSHGCIYCYARTYIKDFNRPRVKEKLLINIAADLSKIPANMLITMSNSSDPYTPPEGRLAVTREVLKKVLGRGHPLLIITKSDLVVRDIDILQEGRVVVSVTITTIDDSTAKLLEPNAPPPSKRLKALKTLTEHGIVTTVRIDPIIPYINDDEGMLKELIRELADIGVAQITASTLKVRSDILSNVCRAFPEVASKLRTLYAKGEKLDNYTYLPRELRLKYLTYVRNLSYERGIPFTTCRESLPITTPGIACDGSTFLYMPKKFKDM
ncbi:MAG: radical SAM protein [Sulfolobales archaeon]